MTQIFQLGCSPSAGKPGDCTPAQLADMVTYRGDTLAAMAPVFSAGIHGGFITDCVQHCHTNIQACWSSAVVGGQTMQDTFAAWYDYTVFGTPPPAGVNTTVVDGPYGTNPTCSSACSPY
jgi:hypothetical protein